MLSSFTENNPTHHYSWVVLLLLLLFVAACFINLRSMKNKVDEGENFLKTSEMTQHIIIVILIGATLCFGMIDRNNSMKIEERSIIAVVEKDNSVSHLRLNSDDILNCSPSYSGSITAAVWETAEGKKKMGLLVGNKNRADKTCDFVLKPISD